DVTLREGLKRASAALNGYEGLMATVRRNPIIASIKVADVMTSPAETLSANGTLEEAIARFDGGRPNFPVVDERGRVTGYCGRSELIAALRELPPLETPISNFMRKDPPVVTPEQSIVDAAVIMLREEIEMLPVVTSDRQVIGVVSSLDVIRKANRP